MSPALLLPAGLGALAALLIPLVIHIARRTESRSVDFAALRWLEARPAPRRRLRLDELGLLAVRLLLLAALALWLAKPVLWGLEDTRPVIAVAPGLNAAALADRRGEDTRLIWLAPGFPQVGEAAPPAPANIVSLIRQLDAELPPETPLEIVVPAVLDGVDAERPRLTRRVVWRPVPGPAKAQAAQPPPALMVRYSAEGESSVRYVRAAATAWAAPGASPAYEAAPISRPVDPKTTHLVWLAGGAPPAPVVDWIRRGGTVLLASDARLPVEGETTTAWRDSTGAPLAVAGRLGQGRVVRLTRPLQPSAIPQLLEPDFPDALSRMLQPPPAPARVLAAAHAPLFGAPAYEQPPFDLRPWLALLIALIFGLERWLATRPGRAVPA